MHDPPWGALPGQPEPGRAKEHARGRNMRDQIIIVSRGVSQGTQDDPSHRANRPSSFEVSMDLDAIDPTSATLLDRVGISPHDEAAWARFVELYGSKIRGWCRRWGLQEADAEDVTQDVLLRLAQKLGTFHYDPSRSFRGWLRTVTRNALAGFLADRKRQCSGSGDDEVLKQLQSTQCATTWSSTSRTSLTLRSSRWPAPRPGACRGPDVGSLPANGVRANLRRRRGGATRDDPGDRLQGQEPRPGVSPRGDQATRRALKRRCRSFSEGRPSFRSTALRGLFVR